MQTATPTLELKFPAPPDEFGVINGMDLARSLIFNAVRLVAPHVKDCPSSLGSRFEQLANCVLKIVHKQLEDGPVGATYALNVPKEDLGAAIEVHVAANQETVTELLLVANSDTPVHWH